LKNTFFDFPIFQLPNSDEFLSLLEGTNTKGILVVIGDDFSEERRAYLTKILTAAKLNLVEDCLLLRGAATKNLPSFAQLKSIQPISKTLIFGLLPSDLGLNVQIPPYTPTTFLDATFLYIDKLSDIEPSPERRKALWACLQKMFL
jgi:hypothetical protein